MIKNIIKRDGRVEPFNSMKVNGWGEWAAKELGGENSVSWSGIVLNAISKLGETCTSEQLQETLIKECLVMETSEYSKMAARLYMPLMVKNIHAGCKTQSIQSTKELRYPTVKEVQQELFKAGLMIDMSQFYTDEEYEQIEQIINHKLNLTYYHYQLDQLRKKYSLKIKNKDKDKRKEFETPQFIFMRMAMHLAIAHPSNNKMYDVERYYYYFSRNIINAPTPNYTNLGTELRGYSSCCVYDANDSINSLAAGDHIAYMMTARSAGIGNHMHTRSIGDTVRGGAIQHLGKLPYYRALDSMVHANMQNGRGGAATMYYSSYDPEIETIQMLGNPISPLTKRINGIDYAMNFNLFFAKKAAKNEEVALFSMADAPELYWAMYDADTSKFEKLYEQFLISNLPRKMMPARDLIINAIIQGYETGRHYLCNVTEMNRHTPFKHRITGSNLCLEIALATAPFKSVEDLYTTKKAHEIDPADGEIGLCSLAALAINNIKDDEEYAEAAYYALKMIDACIHLSEFPFPHLRETALARLSAGVGVIDLAHHMARKGLSYATEEGRNEIHKVFETHYWHLTNASLKLGKELGNAVWMHHSKWVNGWLPIDTYNKEVDNLVSIENQRDWEKLRKEIIENGGIRNTVLVAIMPCESSSLASGVTNGVYPIRDLKLRKTSGNTVTYWVAPNSVELKDKYELAWNIPMNEMIKAYAVMQKWVDQTISADVWDDITTTANISKQKSLNAFLTMVKYGVKTRYYTNSKVSKPAELVYNPQEQQNPEQEQNTFNSNDMDERGCAGGSCSL